MERHNGYTTGLGWFLVGGAAGACAALLLAPASGQKTRARLARRLRDAKETLEDFSEEVADTTRDIAEKASRLTDGVVCLARDAGTAARDAVSSFGANGGRA